MRRTSIRLKSHSQYLMNADKNYLDFDLVRRIRAGDQYAFRDLFKKYYRALVDHARRYVGSTHHAENIVEDVFLKIWDKRKSWNVTIGLKAYLFQSVRNQSLNHVQRLKLERRSLPKIKISTKAPLTPEDYLNENELLESIRQAISELPNRTRCVFTMHRFDNLKYAEIAEILNISVGTVETHMVRALRLLRNRLIDFLSILTIG